MPAITSQVIGLLEIQPPPTPEGVVRKASFDEDCTLDRFMAQLAAASNGRESAPGDDSLRVLLARHPASRYRTGANRPLGVTVVAADLDRLRSELTDETDRLRTHLDGLSHKPK